jgi:hypothetical protein
VFLTNQFGLPIEHFERGRIAPVDVLEQHQYRFLPRQGFQLVEQGRQGQAALLRRAQCERRIALAGRDRQQGSELPLRRVLGGEAILIEASQPEGGIDEDARVVLPRLECLPNQITGLAADSLCLFDPNRW